MNLVFILLDCLTKTNELSLIYYLPIDGRVKDRFILLQRILVHMEMQTASFKISPRVTDSISYHNNHYAKRLRKIHWILRWILIHLILPRKNFDPSDSSEEEFRSIGLFRGRISICKIWITELWKYNENCL